MLVITHRLCLLACLAGLILVSAACAPAPPASVDPVTALRITAPWVLDDAFPEVSQQIVDGVLSDEGFRDATVKHVTGPDGESAFLLVADAGLTGDTDLATFTKRLSTGTGTGAGVETMGDHEVAILQTPDAEIVAWLEPPLLLAVYAADVDTARTIATAVMDAGG